MIGLNQQKNNKKMRCHFSEKESYLHQMAKIVLKRWLLKFPERFGLTDIVSIRTEEVFAESGIVLFKPDITVYNFLFH